MPRSLPRRTRPGLTGLVIPIALALDVSLAHAETTLRWLPPDASDLAGYVIYLGSEPMTFETGFDIGAVSPGPDGVAAYDLDALVAPGEWYVAMTAYDGAANESSLSNQVLIATGPAPECAQHADCDDGDACNGAESCDAGVCTAGHAPVCVEADACRLPRCDATLGCTFDLAPDGTPCDDGDAATEADACLAGLCAGVLPPPPEPDPYEVCLDFRAPPSAMRLTLTRAAPGSDPEVTALWNAPLREEGALLRYRPQGSSGWDSVWGAPHASDGCLAHYLAPLPGLDPALRYEYTVSAEAEPGIEWSEPIVFMPPPDRGAYYGPAQVLFFAGNGVDGATLSPAARRLHALARALRPHVLIGGGGYAHADDAVGSGLALDGRDAVELWLDQVTPATPFLPVFGAAELGGGLPGEDQAEYAALHPYLYGDAPAGSYAFDVGSSHFVALNAADWSALDPSFADGAELLAWLEADLAEARAQGVRFLVVYTHVDLYSSEADAGDDAAARDAVVALFEEHGVNLVLSAAGHSFERSFPMRGGEVDPAPRNLFRADEGVVYLRAGTSGRVDFGRWAAAEPPRWSAARNNDMGATVLLRLLGSHYLVAVTVGIPPDGGPLRALDAFTIR